MKVTSFNTKLLPIFLNYFKGREDFLGVQTEDIYYPIPESLDESALIKHIQGIQTFGIYVLTKDSHCNFICIDIDIAKSELDKIDFEDSQKKFDYLRNDLERIVQVLTRDLPFALISLLFEDTL